MLPNITMVNETSSFDLRVLQTKKKIKRNLVYNIIKALSFAEVKKKFKKRP